MSANDFEIGSAKYQLNQLMLLLSNLVDGNLTVGQRLKCCFEFSGLWLVFSLKHPDWLSVIATSRHDLKLIPNSSLYRQLAFFTLLLNAHNENAHSKKHLIAGCVLCYSVKSYNSKHSINLSIDVLKGLKKSQLDSCCLIYETLIRNRLPKIKWRSHQLTLLWLSKLVANKVDNNASTCFAHIFKQIVLTLNTFERDKLACLADYPGLYPAASILEINGDKTVLVAQTADALITCNDLKMLNVEASDKRITNMVSTKQLALNKWADIRQKVDLDKTQLNWQIAKQFPINRPPSKLKNILAHLRKPNVEINTLIEQIDKEPAFKDFILYSASNANRLSIPVSNITQAIMTYGLERIGSLLVQFALSERLSQHTFLLHSECRQITHIACAIASSLTSLLESTKLLPQTASLLMSFSLSPLFTSATFKTATHLTSPNSLLFSTSSIFGVSNSNKAIKSTYQLAKAWEQPDNYCQLFLHLDSLPSDVPPRIRTLHTIIGISIIWLNEWYFNRTNYCTSTKNYLEQSKQYLGSYTELKSLVLLQVQSLLICPINRG